MPESDSSGWGQDFDEEGNVIGEVPEKQKSFFSEHKWKLIGSCLFFVLLSLPNLLRTGITPGVALGGIGTSVAMGALATYVYVWIRS